nr:ABC transporter permease [Clostridium punense]
MFGVELFKLMKSKKYLIFCLAIIALMTLEAYTLYDKCNNELPEIKLKNNEKLLIDYRAKLQEEKLPEGLKVDYEKKVKGIEEENLELQEEMKNPNKDWREKLTKKNKNLEKKKEEAEFTLNNNEVESINSEILVNNYLLEKHIEPRKAYEINSFNDMGGVISFINIIFLPILVMVLLHDTISGEIQFSTVKLLITKPIKRGNVILTKFLSGFLVASLTVILLEGIALLALGILFNMGNPLYPISMGTQYGLDNFDNISAIVNTTYVVPAYSYLIKILIQQVVFIFSASAFGVLISTMVLNNNTSLMISSITMIGLNIITFIMPQKFVAFFYPFLFTTYGEGVKVVSGGMNLALRTTIVTPTMGGIVCLIWGVGLIIPAYIHFVKKDIVA